MDETASYPVTTVIESLNFDELYQSSSFLAGGSAVALLFGLHRKTHSIRFLCANTRGYRRIVNSVSQDSLDCLLIANIDNPGGVSIDRGCISSTLVVDGCPVKVEFFMDPRLEIYHKMKIDGIPIVSLTDLFAERILANADLGRKDDHYCRAMIDLAIMRIRTGEIPVSSWNKVFEAYGYYGIRMYCCSVEKLMDIQYLNKCLDSLDVDLSNAVKIRRSLQDSLESIPSNFIES